MDDGSRDGTAAVARSLGVRVIEQRNSGVGAARNLAIREAAFPWIAFCDADDLWYPEKLATLRRMHETRPEVDFLFTDYRLEEDGRVVVPSTFASSPEFAEHICERVEDGVCFFEGRVLAQALARSNFIAPSTVVVRRALILEHSIFFASMLPQTEVFFVAEDLEWYLRVLRATDALASERLLVEKQKRAGSLSENSGRVKYGDVKLGEIIAQAPDLYVDGLAAAFAGQRRRHLFDSAVFHGRALRFGEMRVRLREAQRVEFRLREEVLVFLAGLATFPGGRSLARVVRSVWRHLLKPVLLHGRRAP